MDNASQYLIIDENMVLMVVKLSFFLFSFVNIHLGEVIGWGSYFFTEEFNDIECCDNNWIHSSKIKDLEKKLDNELYGQHIAKKIIVNALKGHYLYNNNKKALVLSFHGLTGSGKNYVTYIIRDSIYVRHKTCFGKFFHYFNGRLHFPMQELISVYKSRLRDWIHRNVSVCNSSIFVFDEVDKIPIGVLDEIIPFADYNDDVDDVDFRNVMFIFLSNTGSNLIMKKYLELWKEGKSRDDMSEADFEVLIKMGAFNEKGGLQNSDTIRKSIIDHYIPFLPLEEKHVRLCIRKEFQDRNFQPKEEDIDFIFKTLQFYPKNVELFSEYGCKTIIGKVAAYIADKDNL